MMHEEMQMKGGQMRGICRLWHMCGMIVNGYESELVIEYLADGFDGLHHELFDVGVGLHFLQQALQH